MSLETKSLLLSCARSAVPNPYSGALRKLELLCLPSIDLRFRVVAIVSVRLEVEGETAREGESTGVSALARPVGRGQAPSNPHPLLTWPRVAEPALGCTRPDFVTR